MPRIITPTFADWSAEFMKIMSKRRTPGTLGNYRSAINMHLRPAFGDRHLSTITRGDVRLMLDAIDGPVARRLTYNTLQVMMNTAVEYERLAQWDVKVKGASAHGGKPRPMFTHEEALAVIGHLPDWQAIPLTIVLGTALRVSELAGLNTGDWDEEDGALTVQRQYVNGLLTERTKTNERRTFYPILNAPTLLTEAKEAAMKMTLLGKATPMFVGPRGARFNPVWTRDAWARARAKEGLNEFHIHDLRHISLTLYARLEGVTLADIMTQGGHRSLTVSMMYQHAADAPRRKAIASQTWQ